MNNKIKEIEKLKQGYCQLKEKCNRGEYDFTHKEIDRLNDIINALEKILETLDKAKENK